MRPYYLAVLALSVLLSACSSGSSDGFLSEDDANFVVDVLTGDDTNPGTADAPFKTITFALNQSNSGDVIKVRPGIYDTAATEVLPLTIPAGVSVIGDTATLGNVGQPGQTLITGDIGSTGAASAVILGSSAELAGFAVDGVGQTAVSSPDGVLRFNYIFSSAVGTGVGANIAGGIVTGNQFVNNNIGVIAETTALILFENNSFFANTVTGVDVRGANSDFGGGSSSSTGGNFICDNFGSNMLLPASGAAFVVNAEDNFWDNAPPTVGTGAGNDIDTNGGPATVETNGAAACL